MFNNRSGNRRAIAITFLLIITICCSCSSNNSAKGYASTSALMDAYSSAAQAADITAMEKCFHPALLEMYSLNYLDEFTESYGEYDDFKSYFEIDREESPSADIEIAIRHTIRDDNIDNVVALVFINDWYGFDGNHYYPDSLTDRFYAVKNCKRILFGLFRLFRLRGNFLR